MDGLFTVFDERRCRTLASRVSFLSLVQCTGHESWNENIKAVGISCDEYRRSVRIDPVGRLSTRLRVRIICVCKCVPLYMYWLSVSAMHDQSYVEAIKHESQRRRRR